MCDDADVVSEALLAVEDAFIIATGIRIGTETAIPPFSAEIIKKVVDDAVAEGCGDNLAGNRVMNNEGDATIRVIGATNNTVA